MSTRVSRTSPLWRTYRCYTCTAAARGFRTSRPCRGAATSNEERARLLLRRGDLLASDLGWSEEGVESWRRSLELDPDQAEARSRLESLLTLTAAEA